MKREKQNKRQDSTYLLAINDKSSQDLLLVSLLGEVEHMPFIGVDGVLLAQIQLTLKGTIPAIVVVNINDCGDSISKLGTACGGWSIEVFYQGVLASNLLGW